MTARAIAVAALTKPVLARVVVDLIAIDRRIVAELGKRYDEHAWGQPEFELDLPGKWANSWYATDAGSGKALGYVVASTFGNNLHAHRVAVHPDARRQGVATALMQQLFTEAAIAGCAYCTAQVPYDNGESLDWYLKHGFHLLKDDTLAWYCAARRVAGVADGDHLVDDGDRHWVVRCAIDGFVQQP